MSPLVLIPSLKKLLAASASATPAVCAGALCFSLLFSAGCEGMPEPDRGANQSLVEIGEHSLELAEELENEGRTGEANAAYKRSLWAFKYHERLTGEEPFLLDDALDGIERTGGSR